jgi:hypothetical protein
MAKISMFHQIQLKTRQRERVEIFKCPHGAGGEEAFCRWYTPLPVLV